MKRAKRTSIDEECEWNANERKGDEGKRAHRTRRSRVIEGECANGDEGKGEGARARSGVS